MLTSEWRAQAHQKSEDQLVYRGNSITVLFNLTPFPHAPITLKRNIMRIQRRPAQRLLQFTWNSSACYQRTNTRNVRRKMTPINLQTAWAASRSISMHSKRFRFSSSHSSARFEDTHKNTNERGCEELVECSSCYRLDRDALGRFGWLEAIISTNQLEKQPWVVMTR